MLTGSEFFPTSQGGNMGVIAGRAIDSTSLSLMPAHHLIPIGPQTNRPETKQAVSHAASSFSFSPYHRMPTPSSAGQSSFLPPNTVEIEGQRQVSSLGQNRQTTGSPGTKLKTRFRVHSRHRSMGRLNELAAPEASVAIPKPIRQQQGLFETKSIRHLDRISFECKNQSAADDARQEDMSQTVQSISSLSIQLNRGANLRGLSQAEFNVGMLSGLESEPSSIQTAMAGQVGAPNSAMSNTSNKFSKLVGKKATRVKELLLQNLGKADKTTDEMFKIYEENFYKQQAQATKLHKEFKSYVNALKGAHDASKSLNTCIQQSTSDYQSARHDLVCENLSQLENLNDDLMEKLREQVLVSINEYLLQFDELREKIAKRRRKLIDYDSSRRIYELMLASINKKRAQMQQLQQQQHPSFQGPRSLRSTFLLSSRSNQIQSATSQLVDEARLIKLREQYNYCRVMYETINAELHEELPMVYDKKMKHLLMSLQNYFSLEAQFHSNTGKLYATASDVIDELPMSMRSSLSQRERHSHQNVPTASAQQVDTDIGGAAYNKTASSSSGVGSSQGDSSLDSSSSSSPEDLSCPPASDDEHQNIEDEEVTDVEESGKQVEEEQEEVDEVANADANEVGQESAIEDGGHGLDEKGGSCEGFGQQFTGAEKSCMNISAESEVKQESSTKTAPDSPTESNDAMLIEETKHPNTDQSEEVIKISGKPNQGEKIDCLYKVKTSYKYLAEDVDELCFEADEVIQVVPFEESQEQEEGWLMGVREVNGQRGLFPANFTQPI